MTKGLTKRIQTQLSDYFTRKLHSYGWLRVSTQWGYGYRWKIEEYHRHIKQEYKLEDIQIKTFTGLQSMLAIRIVSMYITR